MKNLYKIYDAYDENNLCLDYLEDEEAAKVDTAKLVSDDEVDDIQHYCDYATKEQYSGYGDDDEDDEYRDFYIDDGTRQDRQSFIELLTRFYRNLGYPRINAYITEDAFDFLVGCDA